jgi:hypothetical protein
MRMYRDDMIKVCSVTVIEVSARPTVTIEPHKILAAQSSINKLTRL